MLDAWLKQRKRAWIIARPEHTIQARRFHRTVRVAGAIVALDVGVISRKYPACPKSGLVVMTEELNMGDPLGGYQSYVTGICSDCDMEVRQTFQQRADCWVWRHHRVDR